MAQEFVGVILDSGALIAADKGDRRFWTFWKRALQLDLDMRVPTTVIAQAWRGANNARMARVLKSCSVETLSEGPARATGELCGRAGTKEIVDSHVVLSAHIRGYMIVTCDSDDVELLAALFEKPPKLLDLRRLSIP
ncbi:MAG: twitching motility protein PilT [Candidatus Riflebacteria bacterium]|nr:twitching motility protein PilT [Candidatus Riflebacteria bacterium]